MVDEDVAEGAVAVMVGGFGSVFPVPFPGMPSVPVLPIPKLVGSGV